MPLIGIPSYMDTSSPDKMPARYAASKPFVMALLAVGASPVIIPLGMGGAQLREIYARLDGVLLAGGHDLNPASYGQSLHPKTEGVDPARDECELIMARWALADRKPVFGICRGIQALNVAAGGTLIQDVTETVPHAIRHQYAPEKPRDYVAHDIDTLKGTRLAKILGQRARVNSFHHQAIERVAPGFHVSACAPDGVIEAIEPDDGAFAVGVQWHPESLIDTDPTMRALFETFIAQADEPGH
ncbi:MAG: gamma-glutamyl-gamma-aminobutyrate hydrolase family protein [Aggregatilineales bacterium]